MILNRVASPRHERLARLGMDAAGIEVLGVLPRRGDLTLPERHLGLIQAVEHPDLDKSIADYAAFVEEHVDLNRLQAVATATNPFSSGLASSEMSSSFTSALSLPSRQASILLLPVTRLFPLPIRISSNIGVIAARRSAFSPLLMPHQTAPRMWSGCPVAILNFMQDASPPLRPVFQPFVPMLKHGPCMANRGYMVLGKQLIDKDGTAHDMLGLLGLVTSYADRKFHLGYRLAETAQTVPV